MTNMNKINVAALENVAGGYDTGWIAGSLIGF